jgi:hypothetical protein
MENAKLQEIWKNIDQHIDEKSDNELNLLLRSKAKEIINKFHIILGASIGISTGVLCFLTIAIMNRSSDLLYIINNIFLGILTLISVGASICSWLKLRNKKYDLSLKEWLKIRIDLLSRWLVGRVSKLYLIVVPILYILSVMSIHVYFEKKSFLEVIKAEESIIGLLVASPIGLFVSFFTIWKIRKYQLNKLLFLKDLYCRLCQKD